MSRQRYSSLQNEGHLKHYKTSLQQNNDYFQHLLENLNKDTHWFQLSILFFSSCGTVMYTIKHPLFLDAHDKF